jgi:hypothetical protein
MLNRLAATALLAASISHPAAAKMSTASVAEAPVFVRGTVTAVALPAVTVKSRSGETVTVLLAQDAQAATTNVIGLDAIKQGSYIGTAAEPDAKGRLTALEVHVFPEAMRGTGDGHRAWTLTPKSSMTNGNVSTVAGGSGGVKGRLLTVDYQGGTKQIYVPDSVPVVAFAPAQLSDIKPGVKVGANRITLGSNGAAPPM